MTNRRENSVLSTLAAILLVVSFTAASGCNKATPLASGIDQGGMDKSVTPGDDFNAYANGGWMKATMIPADKGAYGIAMILGDETRKHLLALIQETAKNQSGSNSEARKVGDFYSAFMDEAAIESKGITPLKPLLDRIAAIADRRDLSRAIGEQLRADVDALNNTSFETNNLFGVWITQGLTEPSHSYPYLLQGGLGMPDRDYYLSPTPHMAELRKEYQAHVQAMFRIAGFDHPDERVSRTLALETKMAGVHATRTESEDVHTAVSWKREDLAARAPGLDWPTLLAAAGLADAPVFFIWHPKAIPGLSKLTATESLDAWRDLLALHAIEHAARFLPKAFVDESFRFYGKALSGIPELRPRWQRGMDYTSNALGEAVGKLYAQRYFPAEAKTKLEEIAGNLVTAFGKRIDALTWMAPATKSHAKAKIATLKIGLGFPDRWVEFSNLEIKSGDALGNQQRAELFDYRRQLAKLHQPVDRGEWWMTPQTVNAVNLPLQNALNFPAAEMQTPYYDPNADAAYNYGSVGALIGHEISHSFDDQGSQFDADGRMANWWTPEDMQHFKAAGEALAIQFDAYKPFSDLSINGHQTLSENIADVAGLVAAYDAYHLSLHGLPDAVKDGFTGDQRFFISFAQSWRSKLRDELLRKIVATDGHAPDQYRASTVRNLDAWYDAFSVHAPQKLYLAPADRTRIW